MARKKSSTTVPYPAPGDASPDNPETIRRVNDENRTDVRQAVVKPVKEGSVGGDTVAQPAPPAEPTPQGTNG